MFTYRLYGRPQPSICTTSEHIEPSSAPADSDTDPIRPERTNRRPALRLPDGRVETCPRCAPEIRLPRPEASAGSIGRPVNPDRQPSQSRNAKPTVPSYSSLTSYRPACSRNATTASGTSTKISSVRLHRLRHVIRRLHLVPGVGPTAKRLVQPNRHLRRNPRPPIHQRRQLLPTHPQHPRPRPSHSTPAAPGSHSRTDAPGWGGLCIGIANSFTPSTSVVVHQVHVTNVPRLETEDDAPVPRNAHGPEPRQVA